MTVSLKHDWHNIIIGHGILWCDRCGALKFPAGTNQTLDGIDSKPNSKAGYILPENLINHPRYDNVDADVDDDGPCIDIRDPVYKY